MFRENQKNLDEQCIMYKSENFVISSIMMSVGNLSTFDEYF